MGEKRGTEMKIARKMSSRNGIKWKTFVEKKTMVINQDESRKARKDVNT